jgi:sugar lactone lactonase YvrE
MTTLDLSRLPTHGLVFPECPRWREDKLWFSDMFDHKVKTVDMQGKTETVVDLQSPAGLGFLPDGTLLMATMSNGVLWRLDKTGLSKAADISTVASRCNDMVVDGFGRAYVDAQSTSIVLVLPDGSFTQVARDLAGPNGMVISPEGKTLVVAETRANQLLKFTVAADGSLSDRRVFAEVEAKPDGICLDAEGAVWVGLYNIGKFIRVREGGEITHSVSFPGTDSLEHAPSPDGGKRTVAAMLGGPERRTLFLCFSKLADRDTEQDRLDNAVGSIYTAAVDVPGVGWP